jgi:hypothetical protein
MANLSGNLPEDIDTEKEVSITLLEIVKEVLDEESTSDYIWESTEITPELAALFTKVNPTNGVRCVDGRIPDSESKSLLYDGPQIAGGTMGLINVAHLVFKKLSILEGYKQENELYVRKIITDTNTKLGWKAGNHKGEAHGGHACGNQNCLINSLLPMYEDLYRGIDVQDIVHQRENWLLTNNCSMPVLKGEHQENGRAIINIAIDKTFNAVAANREDLASFNFDLGAVYIYAGELSSGFEFVSDSEKNLFIKEFARTALRDYLQTLKALSKGAISKVQINKD